MDGGRARDGGAETERRGEALHARWRKNFLTGLVFVVPLYLTVWLIWSVVSVVDAKVERLLPAEYNLQTYVNLPGYGLVVFFVFTALVGALAKNIFAARMIRWSEQMLDQLPIVRTIYNGLKQIAETVLTQSRTSFKKACLVEYPRKGLWAIAFISSEGGGSEVNERVGGEVLAVFLPTTPNPTSGFLLYVPREDVIELDMSIEEAAKLVISGGLVAPPRRPRRSEIAAEPAPAEGRAVVAVGE